MAFHEVCDKAEGRRTYYVSLYVEVPFYGGPEEGGWWGTDVALVASEEFRSKSQANLAKKQVERLAKQLSANAKREFGEQCCREMEWLDARNMDPEDLPEVDGEERYFVVVENTLGEHEKTDDRHYC
jgi:hypothetical protein